MNELFRRFAKKSSDIVGSPWTFALAFLVVLVWAASGPIFNYSDTWQLIINTATTISTGLIVFLVQNTQNRDGKAIQLKLDELLRAGKGARSSFVDLENLSDEELATLQKDFELIHQKSSSQFLKKLKEKIELEHATRKSSNPFQFLSKSTQPAATESAPVKNSK